MSVWKWTLGLALVACCALPAAAQPTSIQTAFSNYGIQDPVAPATTPAPAPAASTEPGCACEPSCGCDNGCSSSDCGCRYFDWMENCSLEELMGMECCCAWNTGGWIELGYMSNNVPLSQAYNDLLSFDDVPDHLHAEQIWWFIERTTDGSCGWDIGGRFDMMYGTDAQKTQAFGNPGAGVRGFGSWDASFDNGEYGWAMPQAYAEVAYCDWKVKLGHFFTTIGYEVIPATGNFFRTHSYTMFNSEPFTHTGALATFTGYEGWTLYSGWVLGWDTGFDQLNGGNAFLGGFSRELNDNATFTYMTTYGNFGWRDGGDDNSYSHSIVFDVDLSCRLKYVLQSDMIETSNPGVSEFETVGLVNYLFYTVNDTVKLGGRMEWWKADGVSFYEATAGVNLFAAKNFVIRPEWRNDWAPGIGLDEDTFSVDAIWSF